MRMTPLILYAIFPNNSAFPYCFFPICYKDFSNHQAKLAITNELKHLIAGASFPVLKCIFLCIFPLG